MPWDPEQYRKFQSERFAPFADLFDMIDVRPGLRVVDLGCGTGELTARLAGQLPGSDVLGVDSSAEMLAQAQLIAGPGLRFEQRAIEDVTVAEEPFRAALGGWARMAPVLSIDEYAEVLYALGATDVIVIEKVYPHVLEDADAIADWVKGTVLVPYLERLPSDLREPFMTRYRHKLRARWPETPVFYPFRRTLFAATRA